MSLANGEVQDRRAGDEDQSLQQGGLCSILPWKELGEKLCLTRSDKFKGRSLDNFYTVNIKEK